MPDYTPAGIRMLGGRIADTRGRGAAYLFYEKGRTLMSVFIVPGERFTPADASVITYRGATYYTVELEGQRAAFWSDDQAAFGLISMLDYDSLLECADRLRAERAEGHRGRRRLPGAMVAGCSTMLIASTVSPRSLNSR